MKKYPCEVKAGDYLVTKDGRRWKVVEVNGKYFVTEYGTCFSRRHPSLEFVDSATEEEILEEAIEEAKEEIILEEMQEEKPKKRRSKKKAIEEEQVEE